MESRKNKYMFYPRFTKVIINHFMSQDQSIPRRNKVDWHMANDDPILTTMRFIPQHEVVQRYSAILPDYLTNPAMKESEAYKIYHDLATRKVLPKPKYVRRSSRTKTDETAKPSSGKRVKTTAKKSSNEDDDDEVNVSEHEDDDDDERTESDNDDDDNSDEEVQGANTEEEEMVEEATHKEDEANELYRDVNVNLEGRDTVMTDAPLPNVQATQETEDTHVILTAPINPEGQQQSSSMSSNFVSNMLNPRPDTCIDSIFTLNTKATSLVDVLVTAIAEPPHVSATTLPSPPTPLITHMQQTPVPTLTTVPSTSLQDLPNFGSLFGLRYEAQAENEDFLNKLDDNIKKIIKNQVKEQVKAQVSKILPKNKKIVNEQLEAEIMTRSSTKSKTSLALAANLTELELKKILIEKMEGNKSIHKSNEQKNLCKALVEAYESDKLILNTYGDISASESAHTEEPIHTDKDLEEPAHQEFLTPDRDKEWNKGTLPDGSGPVSTLVKQIWASRRWHSLKIDTLTPKLLAGLTFKLMKGTCKSFVKLEYLFEEVYKATTDQLDWHNPEGQQYPHDLRKPLPLIPNSRDRQVIPLDHFINNDLVYLSGGVSSRTYETSITKTKAADYDNDKLYTFKEGDFKCLCLQDIEDMLILLVQGKLTNFNIEDRLAFGVFLRMFTRSIVIQRRVEDLQLGVKSYQKKLNITKPDTYRSDLKCRDAYTAYSNPRGFIYQNKDKKNKLMRIDKLHKFSDGTLDDVRTALNDHLKGIRMEYIPKTIWRQNDRERAKAMI
ncbi:hypothetical protein Tco_0097718 [Tanacetum coccineum]